MQSFWIQMACPIIKFVSVSVPLLLFAELSLANDMFFCQKLVWWPQAQWINSESGPHRGRLLYPLHTAKLSSFISLSNSANISLGFYFIMQWVYFYTTMYSIEVCLQSGNNIRFGHLSNVTFCFYVEIRRHQK